MKKTLIALAVLAASGASFAQVTLTGKLGVSLQKASTLATGGTVGGTQGLQVTDGDLAVTAKEDLGAGYSATAYINFATRGRATLSTGINRDATLTLGTPVGALTVGSVELPVHMSKGYGGAPSSFQDGHTPYQLIGDGDTNADIVTFRMPLGGLGLEASYYEVQPTATILTTGAATTTSTTAANTTTITAYALKADYTAGPLFLLAEYTGYQGNNKAGAASDLADGLGRLQLVGNYDFGFAKIGVGLQTKTKSVASQVSAGVSVPVGATVFGLSYFGRASQDVVNSTNGNGTLVAAADARSGYALGMQYNFSKTTNLYAGFVQYKGVGQSPTSTVETSDNAYRIRLMKSF